MKVSQGINTYFHKVIVNKDKEYRLSYITGLLLSWTYYDPFRHLVWVSSFDARSKIPASHCREEMRELHDLYALVAAVRLMTL